MPEQNDIDGNHTDEQQVKYRVLDEIFSPPDDHREIEDPIYVGPLTPTMENVEGAELIEVLEWDYQSGGEGRYSGPPELIRDDKDLKVAYPNNRGAAISATSVTKFVCQRCGVETDTGSVNVMDEIQEPHQCPGCERQGPFEHSAVYKCNNPQEARPLITTTPLWDVPPGVDDEVSAGLIWDDIYDHIHTHWDASGRDWMYEGLTAYALSTWFRPAFDFVPHLLILGKHETGKTRLLNTMKEVSYRAIHTASASPASIYRLIDHHNTTFYLSEYHDIDDETQKTIDSVIKAGQKRGEVALRATEHLGDGYAVEDFQPFTHAAISTQFPPRDDIQSRCFEVLTQPSKRSMPRTITGQSDLRSRLLGLRFRHLDSMELRDAIDTAEELMDEKDLFGREGEKMWCLITMATLADRNINDFIEHAVAQSEDDTSESEEAMFLRATIDEAFDHLSDMGHDPGKDWENVEVKMTDIKDSFNAITGRDISNRYMGTLRKRLGLGKKRKRDGTYLHDEHLQSSLKRLADENNVEWEPSEGSKPQDQARFRGGGDSSPNQSEEQLAQNDRVGSILDEIRVQYKTEGEPPARADVVSAVVEMGYDNEHVESDIDNLLNKGRLYQPRSGHLDVT